MLRDIISCVSLSLVAVTAFAQTGREWQDPELNAVNREPAHAFFADYAPQRVVDVLPGGEQVVETSPWALSLNGLWKFNWVNDLNQRPKTFFQEDFDDAGWVNFPVPALWEMNGYGDPVYTNVPYVWSRQFANNPPFVEEKNKTERKFGDKNETIYLHIYARS